MSLKMDVLLIGPGVSRLLLSSDSLKDGAGRGAGEGRIVSTASTRALSDEEWDGKPNTTGADGFFGKLNEWRKTLTAEAVKAGADTRPVDQQK